MRRDGALRRVLELLDVRRSFRSKVLAALLLCVAVVAGVAYALVRVETGRQVDEAARRAASRRGWRRRRWRTCVEASSPGSEASSPIRHARWPSSKPPWRRARRSPGAV